MRLEDLTGKQFGRLIAIRREPKSGKVTKWLWLCECGNQTVAAADKVKAGYTVSCGCFWRDKCRKHGHGHDANGKQTRTYKAWVNMRSRIGGGTESSRKNYSSRGITLCARWKNSFENFLADMGECPLGKTLDR